MSGCDAKHRNLESLRLIAVTSFGDHCHRIFRPCKRQCDQLVDCPFEREANETHWHASGAREGDLTSPLALEKGGLPGTSPQGRTINHETAASVEA
jgi:hypothetical protein